MTGDLRGRPASPGAPRIRLRSPCELTDDQAVLHQAITAGPRSRSSLVPLVDEHDRLLGPFAVMLLSPGIGAAVQELGAALRIDPGRSPRVRELAILTIAAARDSEFEWMAHERAGLAAGLSTACLQALLDGTAPPDLSSEESMVVVVVRRLAGAGTLDDEEYSEAVAGLGHETLAALVWLVGYYSMLATALATFRPPLEG